MKLLYGVPHVELLHKLLRSRLLIQADILGEEEDCLRQKASREAVEKFLKADILAVLHHGAHEGKEVVDENQLICELVHLHGSSQNENVQLLRHHLQEGGNSQREHLRVCDLVSGQLKKVCHAVDKCVEQPADHAVELEVQLECLWAARVSFKKRQVLLYLELGESLNHGDKLLAVHYILGEDVTVAEDHSLPDPGQHDCHQSASSFQSLALAVAGWVFEGYAYLNEWSQHQLVEELTSVHEVLKELVGVDDGLHEELVEHLENYYVLSSDRSHLIVNDCGERIGDGAHGLQFIEESSLVGDAAEDDLAYGLHHIFIDADLAVSQAVPWTIVVQEVGQNEVNFGDVSLIDHVLLVSLKINHLVLLLEVAHQKLNHFHLNF